MAIFDPLWGNRDVTRPTALPPPPPLSGAPIRATDALATPQASRALPGLTQSLPPAPPAKPGTAFDDDNYRQTMLALAAGFFGSKDLGEGLGRAAETLYGRNEALRQQGMPQLGGPDDAFEVYTDPKTGERTYKPIQQFVDYQRNKRLDPADDADMTGRAMYALSQLPKEEQAGAYEDILSNPSLYGIRDTSSMPAAFDPRWVQMATNRGMTVSQARTRDQAVQNGESAQDARERALALREQALAIAERKATASIAQGNQRIGIAREALHKRSSGSGSSGGKGSVTDMSDSDLLSFILN